MKALSEPSDYTLDERDQQWVDGKARHACPYCGDEVEHTGPTPADAPDWSWPLDDDHFTWDLGYWLHVDDNTPICAEEP